MVCHLKLDDWGKGSVRDRSSITLLKRWVGGVRNGQFLMIYSNVNHQRVGWVGLKKSKTWWRNTWMVLNAGNRVLLLPYTMYYMLGWTPFEFNFCTINNIFDKDSLCILLKGQLISKCLFSIFNSSKKQMIKFDFTTMVPQVKLFSFIFWENWKHQKDISKLIDL